MSKLSLSAEALQAMANTWRARAAAADRGANVILAARLACKIEALVTKKHHRPGVRSFAGSAKRCFTEWDTGKPHAVQRVEPMDYLDGLCPELVCKFATCSLWLLL